MNLPVSITSCGLNSTCSVSREYDGLTRIDRNVDADARRVDTHFV